MGLRNLFNSKVNILRVIKAADALGGWTEVENILYLNLPCRINWKSGSKKIFFDKNTYFRDGKLYCNVIDVIVNDRVFYNSRTYEVVDVNNTDEVGKFLALDIKLVE